MQGSAAGGKTGTEACVGAAQVGAAQRGGAGTTAPLRSGDRAPQEAAEAGGGQRPQQTAEMLVIFMSLRISLRFP